MKRSNEETSSALIVDPYPARFPDLEKKKILKPSLCYETFFKKTFHRLTVSATTL